MFAYLAQCRCDPANTILYFSQFYNIVDTMKERGASPPEILELLVAEERSRSRFTDADLHKSLELLGFGKGNILDIELDDDVSDNFVIQAWKDAQKRAWQEPSDKAATLRSDLNDALKIVADFKDSPTLLRAWERGKAPVMTEDTAYSTLEVPKEVDETMLLTIFNLRIEDQPTQADKMREALTVIAEIRNSQRLREFISSGRDPEDIASETRLEMPRGLNQLGNTCYLNSLLQYFYTIKDLRLAISASINDGEKSLYDLKFTDDDLKHHRRNNTHSSEVVHQLANLFWNMEYCDTAAVTPTKELAQLALITSQDEEEDDQGGTNTDASNDTDATLVEDGPVRPSYERSSQSPSRSSSSPSVLGKRVREFPRTQGMDVDGEPSEADKDGFVMVSKPTSPPDPVHSPIKPTASSSKQKTVDNAPDVEMQDLSQKAVNDAKPPPLPPRKPRETSDSTMMFGRQHDVSECMDNCMFQIETALLDLPDEEMAGAESDKTSVIKRLFYGKKRQRLTPLTIPNEQRRRTLSMHDKEDLFSHLHVNVSDEGFDLYDGLSRYFDDIVEVDGVKKRMEVTLVDLPPLLQIQLQRVQFDRDTQQAYKSQAYVKFGDTIYMDRFLDSADSEKKSRSKDIQARLTVCRDRIQKLTQGKHAPFAPALGETAHFLSNQKVLEIPEANADLTAKLKSEQAYVVSQLEQERASSAKLKKELEEVWKSDAKAAYQLTSVFIHRGSSPSFGHYFFYARNLPERPDQWFKYNDSTVSVVSKDEVLADTTGSTANPYMLVFARKDAEVIDTVHRFDPTTLEDA
ncbi:hypothetical protein EW026_g4549 [Hermanssonia centrifuga]|uniref:Ubiquitin carboxyl-terminal hydrolase n=1 Tax=Hermanssonia centrifuga TaxID=98765 RepID=A0A4S4KH41_9APHY|nr:hypothetical protein EW026_g4549 [Hermanssonia centrifuga]